MIYECSNGRRLIITTKEFVGSVLSSSGLVPCVVLLTTRHSESASMRFWESLIRFLLDKGCSYFVCVGTYSESLHDAIDDFFYQYNEELGIERSRDIVTTYHTNETTEDVIAYFVHGTELRRKENGCLVAILDDSPEDQEIRNFIKNHESTANQA
jgi:hypothetical protein